MSRTFSPRATYALPVHSGLVPEHYQRACAVAAAPTRRPAPSTAAAIAAKASATTAVATIFAWPGLVHCQIATVQIRAIELLNRLLTFFLQSHFHEPNPLERPVSRSSTTVADSTVPAWANSCCSSSPVVETRDSQRKV